MKKQSPSSAALARTKVEVNVKGPAYRITAYVVNSRILKEIESLSDEDAEYEENKYSAVAMRCLDSMKVATGFYADDLKNVAWSVAIGGLELPIDDVVRLYEGCEFPDLSDCPRERALVGPPEKVQEVGAGFSLGKGQFFVFEVEDIKLATGKVVMEIPGEVSLADIELGIVDLDVETELAEAAREAGILRGADLDVRSVHCKGECSDFDYDILNSYPSNFYVVRRAKGQEGWESKFLG